MEMKKFRRGFCYLLTNYINYLPLGYLREVAQNLAGSSSKPPGAYDEHEEVLKPTSEWF